MAFEQILQNFHPSIFSLLCKWTGNWHDAEDLTQETFLRAFKYLKTFRIEENFKTWLYKIALNLVHDHYKHQRGSPVTESLDDVLEQNLDWGPSATEKVFRSQLLKIVYGILPGLTCRERSVFVLKTMEGLENDEVSRILQISQTTVRRFYGLARRKILEAVEQKMNLSGIHL